MNLILHKNIDDTLFQEVWHLYESSFPEIERRALAQHTQALADKRFNANVYCNEKGELIALCFYWELPDFIYLEHFAIQKQYRQKGIGSQILTILSKLEKPIILEIEPPTDEITHKRLRFYQRNGFSLTPYLFKQLKYQQSNPDLFLNLLCNGKMTKVLFDKFFAILHNEISLYCE